MMFMEISEWDQIVKNVNTLLETGAESGAIELGTVTLEFEVTEDNAFKLEVLKDA